MKKNEEYKQISVHQLNNYDALKDKVVDKVAFTDRGYPDEHMFIITFTDKTYVAVGTGYKDLDNGNDEPQLENYWVMDPKCCNGGDYHCHIHVDANGNLKFDRWIQILKDLGIWDLEIDEAQQVIEKKGAEQEAYEYKTYLRLKEKFDKNG